MSVKHNPYIFILLREQFDELLATTLITRLRYAGLRVKVVSQRGLQPVKGKHGLNLMPDLRLDKAQRLANEAVGLIALGFSTEQAKDDPRVVNLIRVISDNWQSFIVGEEAMLTEFDITNSMPCPADPEEYYEFSELVVNVTPMR